MRKRKAEEFPQESIPVNRPRTRFRGKLTDSQSPLSVSKRPPVATTTKTVRPPDGRRPTKEKYENVATAPSNYSNAADLDMLLSPVKRKTTPGPSTPSPTRIGTPRQFMDAVLISTPKTILGTFRSPPGHVLASPSPSRPQRHTGKVPTDVSSGDERMCSPTTQALRRSSASVIFQPPFVSSSVLSHGISSACTLSSPPRPAINDLPLPRPLPSHLVPHLHSQRKAVLRALQHPPLVVYESSPYPSVFNQLTELVVGTTERHEGNSCLILGPKGSGKSRLVDRVLTVAASNSTRNPVIVHLSAHCQTNDRLAMQEIARQIHQQIGSDYFSLVKAEDKENLELTESDRNGLDLDLPPSSHLPGMIAALPGLGRPIIVVLDGLDGFATHTRQALLYCLLDTVQSCRGGVTPVMIDHECATVTQDHDSGKGIAVDGNETNIKMHTEGEHGLLVIGITSRVDCLTLLEKRVKSRFSHRVMRVATPPALNDFVQLLHDVLNVNINSECTAVQEWRRLWTICVKDFVASRDVLNVMTETFAFGKDLRVLFRLMITPVIALTPSSPWLIASHLIESKSVQRCPKRFPFLRALPYPHVALLIAAAHTQASGHDTFNFEMLYDKFTTQVRMSFSAPVQIEGGGLGMVKIGRGIMMGAFEHLVSSHVFRPVATPSTHLTKAFVRFRCMARREDIRVAVEQLGQTNLKKWFSKNQ